MESHSAELEKVKYKVFVGVQVANLKVYSITCDGHIYVFNKNRELLRWMNIKV